MPRQIIRQYKLGVNDQKMTKPSSPGDGLAWVCVGFTLAALPNGDEGLAGHHHHHRLLAPLPNLGGRIGRPVDRLAGFRASRHDADFEHSLAKVGVWHGAGKRFL